MARLMDEDGGNPFWAFSLTLYMREGVAAACLALQDRRALDVNLLLFCCWAGAHGRALSAAEVDSLIAATRDWRAQVVQPLRAARRWLKEAPPTLAGAGELRQDIKASELAAEAIEQDILHQALPIAGGAPCATILAANLRTYLTAEGCRPCAEDLAALVTLLLAAAPGLDPTEARRLLGG